MRLPLPDSPRLSYVIAPAGRHIDVTPLAAYSDLACAFLGRLSQAIFAEPASRGFPDLVTFAYWCRKANIEALKARFGGNGLRIGRGVVFHLAPNNVPLNFAFSFAFALLAGNASIVKIPSRDFPQIDLLCRLLGQLFDSEPAYDKVRGMSALVRYKRDDDITRELSALCHVRVIWGGDDSIANVRKHPLAPRAFDVTFSDRYSFCVIDAASLARADDAEIGRVAAGFHADAFVMDQNACSSPHLLVWLGEDAAINAVKPLFWAHVYRIAQARYQVEPIYAMDKFVNLCSSAIAHDFIIATARHGNLIYRLLLNRLPETIAGLRGTHGYFHEFHTGDLGSLAAVVDERFQTLTYYGLTRQTIEQFIIDHSLRGIDRAVPIGEALNIGPIWDGYDVVATLSRIVDIS